MTKSEMQKVWDGPLQNAYFITHWNRRRVRNLRLDGLLPNKSKMKKSKTKDVSDEEAYGAMMYHARYARD